MLVVLEVIYYCFAALAIFYTFGSLAPVHDRGNYSAFRQVALGVVIFPLICLVIWSVFDPQLSSGLINGAAVLTLVVSGVFAYRRSQWLRLRFLGLSSLTLIVAKFLPKAALFETVGLNSGNGDLAYYSTLARFLRESSWRDTGWILDVNLATDLFDSWGNGGFTGASLLAGVSILTDSSPGEMALSVALALVITLGFASFLLLDKVFPRNRRLLLWSSLSVVFAPYLIFLVSMSFLLMLHGMICVTFFLYCTISALSEPKLRIRLSLAATVCLTIISLLIAYPSVGLYFVCVVIAMLIALGLMRICLDTKIVFLKKPLERIQLPSRSALVLLLASIIVGAAISYSRIGAVFRDFALMTGNVAGFPLMIAKPSTFFGASLQSPWSFFDLVLMVVLAITGVSFLRKQWSYPAGMLVTFALSGAALTAYFSFKNGAESYTAWKASFFLIPILQPLLFAAALFVIIGGIKKFGRLPTIALTTCVLVTATSTVGMALSGSINFSRPDLDNLKTLLEQGTEPNQYIALGALDQLWAVYFAQRQVAVLAPNIHLARPLPANVVGTSIHVLTYTDLAWRSSACPGLKEISTVKSSGVFSEIIVNVESSNLC